MIYKFIHCSLRRFVKDALDNVVLIIVDFKSPAASRHFIFSLTHFSGFGVIVSLLFLYLFFETANQFTFSD